MGAVSLLSDDDETELVKRVEKIKTKLNYFSGLTGSH